MQRVPVRGIFFAVSITGSTTSMQYSKVKDKSIIRGTGA